MSWRMNQQDNHKGIHEYWIAFVIFCSMSPYFLWRTFTHSGLNMTVLIQLVFIMAEICLAVLHRNNTLRRDIAFLVVLLFIIGILIYLFNGDGLDFYPARLIPLISIIVFLCFDDEKKVKIFDCFMTVIALSLIIGICIYLLNLIGFSVPYRELQAQNEGKTAVYQFYRQYFGAVQIDSVYESIMPRLCGMFDEPGVVGTFCALFLIAKKLDLKDWRVYIFILGGILSLSMAFIFLVIIGLTLFSLNRENKILKIILIILSITMIVLLLAPSLSDYVFSRLGGGNIYTIMNGRMANVDSYHAEMSRFWNGDFGHLLFGMGYNASMQNANIAGSYYYTMPVYDHGVFGIVLIIWWFLALIRYVTKRCVSLTTKRNIRIFSIVFACSISQRPYVLSMSYITTLLGGALMMLINENKTFTNIGNLE